MGIAPSRYCPKCKNNLFVLKFVAGSPFCQDCRIKEQADMVASLISEELLQAYNATQYVVHTKPELILQIGIHAANTDLLLSKHGAKSACIVTAWNPFSQSLSTEDNIKRNEELIGAVNKLELQYLDAEGRDPEGKWPSEKSLCVFDATDSMIKEWMRVFGQNAVVVVNHGQPPTLVLHPDL
jgi:hypothetical protein